MPVATASITTISAYCAKPGIAVAVAAVSTTMTFAEVVRQRPVAGVVMVLTIMIGAYCVKPRRVAGAVTVLMTMIFAEVVRRKPVMEVAMELTITISA